MNSVNVTSLFLFFPRLDVNGDSLVSRELVQVHETLQVFGEFLEVFLSARRQQNVNT